MIVAAPADASAARAAIGVDLGGSKTEAIVLDAAGHERWRRRIVTPAARYDDLLDAVVALVQAARDEADARAATIGIGTPGSLTRDGVLKNANTVCLNGQPLQRDLEARLGQPVRLANDANCLALSEATDGAGADAEVVFAAILGTGVGAGIAVQGRVLTGPNRLAGEWGHNPLPWADDDELRPLCYCGQQGCIETLLCGPAMSRDHAWLNGLDTDAAPSAEQIAGAASAGDRAAAATLARWQQRLARATAQVINLLDPDVIVLGGGLSRIASTYAAVPALWPRWVFSGGVREPVRTRLVPSLHGDSSGVRGAAWLWRQTDALRPITSAGTGAGNCG
jgi:fructokinase